MELERKLKGKGFDAELVSDVLDALERANLLSNLRFTEQFVHQRAARGQGPLKILHELAQRGIDEGTAREFIELSDPIWIRSASRARTKRFGEKLPQTFRDRARQTRFLEQRGFSHEQIRRALAAEDVDDHEEQ